MSYDSSSVTVSVDVKEVQAMFVRLSEIGTVKTKEIKAVVRKAALPIKAAAKAEVPVNKKTVNTLHATVRRHYRGGKFKLKVQIHEPGNLRKSIYIFNSRVNKLLVYIGNMTGRSKSYSAPYGRLIHFGFRAGGKTHVQPNPFMDRAYERSWDNSISVLSSGLWAIIKRESEK